MHRVASAVALLIVLTCLGVTPPARAAQAAPGPTPQAAPGPTAQATDAETRLAQRFAPAVRLVAQPEECGPGEPYLPTDVDALLGNDSVALRGPWDQDDLIKVGPSAKDLSAGLRDYHLDFPGNPLRPGCDYETWARHQTEAYQPTLYAHVVTDSERSGRLALQYWFFYAFNDWNNTHEGDWELIQREFSATDAQAALGQQPVRVGYSQHEGVEVAAWDDDKLELVDGTHPVVHPAAGSHANFYESALFLGRSGSQGFGCDDTRGPLNPIRPVVKVIPPNLLRVTVGVLGLGLAVYLAR